MHISPELLPTVIELLIVLGIMVLVHEFGHFAAAKLCGVRVETFSIGFGTRLLGFRRGDTDYRLSILPLGGYVKMAGDVPGEAPSGDPGEFNAHPRWQRVIIALAGPFANLVLTFLLLFGLAIFHNEVDSYRYGPAITDYVPVNTPVAAAGLQSGDTIVHFADRDNPTWEDVLNDSLLNLNRTLPFSFTHNGQRTDTQVKLTTDAKPENFDPVKVGLVPRQQTAPMRIKTEASAISADTPAQRAGLRPGDTLLSFNGLPLHSVIALHPYLQDLAGKPVSIAVEREMDGHAQPLTFLLTPVLAESGTPDGKYYQIGFSPMPAPVRVQNLSAGPAIALAAQRTLKDATLIVGVLKGMFTHRVSVKSISGPIGIGQEVHQAFKMEGYNTLVEVMAMISINLGIFNLLPIPILDGGMILFLAIESAMRRDLNQQIKERVYQVAFVCLIAFAAFVIFNDVTRLALFSRP